MENLQWFIGGILFGWFIRPFVEVMTVIFKNAWKKYKEQYKAD